MEDAADDNAAIDKGEINAIDEDVLPLARLLERTAAHRAYGWQRRDRAEGVNRRIGELLAQNMVDQPVSTEADRDVLAF